MKFNVDSHFVIGSMHIRQNMPCQDHTKSGTNNESAFISLSDGCSTGGETDIGARILNSAVAIVLKDLLNTTNQPLRVHDTLRDPIRSTALSLLEHMDLSPRDLQATLMYAVATEQGGFIEVFGDGYIILVYANGEKALYELTWKQNTPYYISYTGATLEYFLSRHQSDDPESFVVEKNVFQVNGAVEKQTCIYTALDGTKGFRMAFSKEELEKLSCIMLCSDGIGTFTAPTGPLETSEVMYDLTSFKGWQGEFVKRRLSRMLRTLSEDAIFAYDDISVAALHIDAQNSTV